MVIMGEIRHYNGLLILISYNRGVNSVICSLTVLKGEIRHNIGLLTIPIEG